MPPIKRALWLALLAAIALTTEAFAASPLDKTNASPAGNSGTSLQGEAAVAHLKADGTHQSLTDAFLAARYQIDAGPTGATANNDANGLQMTFGGEGWQLKGTTGEKTWVSSWRLSSFGRGSEQTEAENGQWHSAGNRSELRRESQQVTEWFVNRPKGVEHGYTLAVKPNSEKSSGSLRMVISFGGDLEARADDDGQGLTLLAGEGAAALRYEKLKVWDALGKEMASRMETNGSDEIWLEVDDAEAVYPLTIDPTFIKQQTLTANDGASSDYFGYRVGISGDTVIVGAKLATGVQDVAMVGAVYVFVRSGSTWLLQQKLTAPHTAYLGYMQGMAIAGDTIFLQETHVEGSLFIESVAVFVRSGTTWTLHQRLSASEGTGTSNLTFFGSRIAVSGDTAVLSADASGPKSGQGAAYVFIRSGTTWTEQQKLTAEPSAQSDRFGSHVDISGDSVIVSGRKTATRIFVRTGATWSQQQILTVPSNGGSVAISGETAMVGSIIETVGSNAYQGSAYVFVRSGTIWTEQQKLTASDGARGSNFGYEVAISEDFAVVVAQYAQNSLGSLGGAAYIFLRLGTTWTEQEKVPGLPGVLGTFITLSVGISGNTVVIGEPMGNSTQGSAIILHRPACELALVLPETRYNPGDTFLATINVKSFTDETLTVTFVDPLLQEQPASGSAEDAILTIGNTELPAPFALTPEDPSRSFEVLVEVDERGITNLMSSLSYTGSGGLAGTLSAEAEISVPPLEVTIKAKPLIGGMPIVNMQLNDVGEVTDEEKNPISPKVEVTIENLSQKPVIAFLQSVDPRARDRSVLPARVAVLGEFPVDLGTIAAGQSLSRVFDLKIVNDGRFEFSTSVSGRIVGSSKGFRAVGSGAPIAVGERYPVELELKYVPSSAIIGVDNGAYLVKPGSSLAITASVKNLTSNSSLEFYGIEAEKHLNAFNAILTSDLANAFKPPFPHDHAKDCFWDTGGGQGNGRLEREGANRRGRSWLRCRYLVGTRGCFPGRRCHGGKNGSRS